MNLLLLFVALHIHWVLGITLSKTAAHTLYKGPLGKKWHAYSGLRPVELDIILIQVDFIHIRYILYVCDLSW